MASFDFATLRSGRTGDYLTTAGPEPGEGLITSQPLVRSRVEGSQPASFVTAAGPEPGEGLRTNGRFRRAKDSRTGDYLTTAGPEPGEGLRTNGRLPHNRWSRSSGEGLKTNGRLPHNRWSGAGRRTQDERAGPEIRTNGRLPHNRWSGAGRRTQDEREITSQPLVQSRAKDSGRTGDYLTTAGPEPGEGLKTNGRLPHNRWSRAGRRTQDEREITSQPLVQSRAKDSRRTGDYLTTAGPEPGEGLRTNGRLPHNRWSGAGRRTQDERGNGPYRSP